jgi:hypothetical protein
MNGDAVAPEIEALAKENDRLSVDIRSLESMIDKFMGFGVTVIGIGFTYGVKEELVPVFFFLPVAMLGLLFFTADRMRSMMWLGGYKHAVEDRINQLVGVTVTSWEKLVQDYRGRGDVIIKSTYVIYLLLFGGIIIYSGLKVFMFNVWAGGAFSGVMIVLVVLLIASVRRLNSSYPEAYKLSSAMLGKPSGRAGVAA